MVVGKFIFIVRVRIVVIYRVGRVGNGGKKVLGGFWVGDKFGFLIW